MPARQPGDERDEPNETEIFGQKAFVFAANTHQLLVAVILADRDDQDAARSERPTGLLSMVGLELALEQRVPIYEPPIR